MSNACPPSADSRLPHFNSELVEVPRCGTCGSHLHLRLVDDVRHELAHHLLRNTTLAVSDIAACLRYSDGTVFPAPSGAAHA